VAYAWAECAAYREGDEETKHALLLPLLLAFTGSAFEFTGKMERVMGIEPTYLSIPFISSILTGNRHIRCY